MTKKENMWCIYSGDTMKDGVIDGTDLGQANNDASNYFTGYVRSDVNGDRIVDD
ncbi:MAG: hypothetical protein IPG02_11845 [Ignavibacteria bacterium]|nr:hypothetical protein [Ignavibacteria bacterium]